MRDALLIVDVLNDFAHVDGDALLPSFRAGSSRSSASQGGTAAQQKAAGRKGGQATARKGSQPGTRQQVEVSCGCDLE